MINLINKIKISLIILYAGMYLYSQPLTNKDIILTPINSAYLFNDFKDSLYPFIHSTKIIKLDNVTNLKLLDEIEYSNGLFGDILKVEVVSGKYRGVIGFILEESLALTTQALINGANLFFKDEVVLDNNFKITKETQCRVLESRAEYGEEILTLELLSPQYKNVVIKYTDKNNLHFVINKTTEINYYLRKGFKVIKAINANNLQTIQDAYCNNIKSDESGIIYIDNEDKKKYFKITKDGFTESIIIPDNIDNNIFLALISPLEIIRHLDEYSSIYEKNNFKITIKHKDKSLFKKIGIKTLGQNDLTAFCFPQFSDENYAIDSGFFITNTDSIESLNYEINDVDKKYRIFFFDEKSLKWINHNYIKNNNKLFLHDINDGYYLIIYETENKISQAKLILDKEIKTSQFFLQNEDGNYFTQIFKPNNGYELNIPDGKYEVFFFTPEIPDIILHYGFNTKTGQTSIDTKSYFDKKEKNNQKLSKLFYGKWFRRIIKIDQNIVKNNEPAILETLGNMVIESANKISFYNKDLLIEGSMEIVDNNKLNIHISNINKLVKNYDGSNLIKVNPSLFNSELIIPTYYSFKAGIFQISFDNIYFTRKRYFYKKADSASSIKMESAQFGYPAYPASEKEAKYQLYFTQ